MTFSFFEMLKDKYAIQLNQQQKAAVLHKDGPAIVLAVPGAGKTTMLICRTGYLILHGQIAPENILSITFSKASAKDMEKRFQDVFGNHISKEVSFSTIHSFAYTVLREYARIKRIRYTFIEGSHTPVNKVQLLKQIYKQVNHMPIGEDQIEELSSAIGYVKNTMLPFSSLSEHHFSIDGFQEIYRIYEEYKKTNHFIDFDDMLTLSLEILRATPNLLHFYQQQYPYIQVDEAQDTSVVQHEIIRLLASKHQNLFMVADDDQSIYGFRGSSPSSLLQFESTYPGAVTFFMEENYRSSKDIVRISNLLIQTNQNRYNKNLFTQNTSHRPIKVVELKDEIDQMNYLINQLGEVEDFSQTAILFRNNISAIPLADKLERHGIPFYTRDTKTQFFKHWIVQDILSFFKVALDPQDIDSFERIYYKIKGYISKAAVHHARQNPKPSLFEGLMYSPQLQSFQINNIHRLSVDFKTLSEMEPSDGIAFIQYHLEYKNHLESSAKKLKCSYEYLNSILSYLQTIAVGLPSLSAFLERMETLEQMMTSSRYNKNKRGIALSTIHGAKGLEYEQVYMVDLIHGQFPTASSVEEHYAGNSHALEEERRLFYVGMTRAKKELHLLLVKNKNGEPMQPSLFVREVQRIQQQLSQKSRKEKAHIFSPGLSVHHSYFGKGTILDIHQDRISIAFDTVGRKDLSLDLCMEKELLSING